ncbi:MAG: 50S ribosomal protein L24e [Nanoarchaeota archaeon]
MVNCSFCGKEVKKGSGKMFVRDNGQILYFCKSKCEKNMLKLKRDARKFKWTNFYSKGESVQVDPKQTKQKQIKTRKKENGKN